MTSSAGLPSWDTIPPDVPAAIRAVKDAIRRNMLAHGTTIEAAIAAAEKHLHDEIAEIAAIRARGDEVWPVLQFDDVASGRMDESLIAAIRRRGCVVVKGTFDRSTAEAWDADIVDYVTRNHFFDRYRGPGDDFFETVDSQPEIYPIYWSHAQMSAQQDPRMAAVRSLLNRCWTYESEGVAWFDPTRDLLYPDRIRRRPPGATSPGLNTHLDAGTIDLWLHPDYQRAFATLFRGDFSAYDPWTAAHRVDAANYSGSTMCSVFRTFQGWTALSDMRRDQGVLHTVPIPRAFGYLLLRPLLDDVRADDLCGTRISRVFPVTPEFHSILTPALCPIPDVEPGDTVWWHCDLVHSVAPVVNQQGWGNVMYIPAAPWCAKNERYAESVRSAFASGHSPNDFPDEHYEADWEGRFLDAALNQYGRAGMGFA